jgi:hypothetical protein
MFPIYKAAFQFTDRQNVDKITENIDFVWPCLTASRKGYIVACRKV